jgi:hypothetical protein
VTAGQTATLTAAALNVDGQPQAGTTISFTVSGANTASGSADTDSGGGATFQYVAKNVGTDTVTGVEVEPSVDPLRQAAGGPEGTATVSVVAPPPATPILALGPSSQTVGAGQTASVSATAVSGGRPEANAPISFIVSGANPQAARIVDTNSLGSATFSYVATNAGADTVTAFEDSAHTGAPAAGDPEATADVAVSAGSAPPGSGGTTGTTGVTGPSGCVAPTVMITSDQGRSGFLVGDVASVSITASAPSGLSRDPAARDVRLDTSKSGAFALSRTATSTCGESTTATFHYTVLPAPVIGKSVNLEPVSGQVYVELPGAKGSSAGASAAAFAAPGKGIGFIPLQNARQVPVGTIVDTRAGTARLASAASVKGKLYTGSFFAGLFRILQSRAEKGLTSMDLIDPHVRTATFCASTGKSHVANAGSLSLGRGEAGAASAQPAKRGAVKHALSKKVLGLLKSTDSGEFAVRGAYAAATVRGTQFTVTDRCDGTLTRVTRGVVSVTDLRTRRTVTLRAGHSFLAAAPPFRVSAKRK